MTTEIQQMIDDVMTARQFGCAVVLWDDIQHKRRAVSRADYRALSQYIRRGIIATLNEQVARTRRRNN